MSLAGFLENLAAFWVQGVCVAAAAAILARVLPIERPALKLAWWQAVLVAAIVLPFLGSWAPVNGGQIQIRFGRVSPVAASAAASFGRSYWAEATAAVLALGLLIRALRLLRGAWRLRTCRRRAVPFEPGAIAGLEDAVGARAEIRLSPDVAVPATFGLRRPVILLPTAVQEMASDHQRAIVAHELLHVRRRDWPLAIAEEGLAAVLWFHPAIQFFLGRIRVAREQCVDLAVVETLGGRKAYLESLLEMARRRVRPEPLPAALFLGESHLTERVELLLKEVVMSRVRALCHVSLGALLLVLTGAVVSSSFPLASSAAPANEPRSDDAEALKVREPHKIRQVWPVYPEEVKKDHIEGTVNIDIRLAKDGSVAEAKATKGPPVLAEAALVAVRQWRYEPTLGPDDKPVEVKFTVHVGFRLAGSATEPRSDQADPPKAREPRKIHQVSPTYPEEAKKDHIEGTIHIDIRLAKDGSVAEAEAKNGPPVLAEAALAAVRQWRYEPVLGPDDNPVEATLTVHVSFRLAE